MDKSVDAKALETLVAKVFKLTTEELASLYNDAGELTNWDLIESKDAERISKFKTANKSQYDLGFKKGAESIESAIKTKFNVDDSELIGVELFENIVETKVAEVKGASPEDVLKHPDVIKALNELGKEHSKEKKALEKEWQTKIEEKERAIYESQLFSEVESAALVDFEGFNPILPADPKKAKALKDIYIAEIKKQKHQKDKDGFTVLKEDGTLLTDEHGHPVTFQERNKNIAEKYFDFKVASDRSNAGNNNQNGQGTDKVRVPKDKDEYVTMMKNNDLTPEERVAIMRKATEAKVI